MTIKVFAWPKDRNQKENPYNFLLYQFMSSEIAVSEFNYRKFDVSGADILHVHWPDRLLDDRKQWRLRWRFSRLLKAVDKLHRQGGKLIWTVHNLQSREIQYPELAKAYLEKFIRKVDGFIFLTESGRKAFVDIHPNAVNQLHAVIPHMHYQNIYQPESKINARHKYNITTEQAVLGFFGKVRANKGIDDLIDCTNKLVGEKPHLFIAGNPGKRPVSEKIKGFVANRAEATSLLRYIEDEEVGSIFSACDVMIFPYVDILNSGSALLSLSLGKPVIAPNIGSFPDLQRIVGDQWVYLFEQPLSSKKLDSALEWLKQRSKSLVEPDLSGMQPEIVSEQTQKFYERVMA